MQKTYLYVDMDYWLDEDVAYRAVDRLLSYRRDIPTFAVMNYQQLLPAVNASDASRLINIDEHSDLHPSNVSELHCGSWVSYVRWRSKGSYLWIRNCQNEAVGKCSFEKIWDSGTDWKACASVYRDPIRFSLLPFLPSCVGIGLCMSPFFSSGYVLSVFNALVKKYSLPYRKGRWDERTVRQQRPPRELIKNFSIQG